MKKFNEWLSFRSNSYHETETHGDHDFNSSDSNDKPLSGNANTIIEKIEKMIEDFGGSHSISNKSVFLSRLLRSIYDLSDTNEFNKMKNDLHTVANEMEKNQDTENLKDLPDIENFDDVDSKLDLSDLHLDGK